MFPLEKFGIKCLKLTLIQSELKLINALLIGAAAAAWISCVAKTKLRSQHEAYCAKFRPYDFFFLVCSKFSETRAPLPQKTEFPESSAPTEALRRLIPSSNLQSSCTSCVSLALPLEIDL